MKIPKSILALMLAIEFLSFQTFPAAGDESKIMDEPSLIAIVDAPVCDPDTLADNIQKKTKNLSDEICGTSDIANTDNTGFFTQGQKDFYKKQCERTKEWVGQSKEKFSNMGKKEKNKDSCDNEEPDVTIEYDCSQLNAVEGFLDDATEEMQELNLQTASRLQTLSEERSMYFDVMYREPQQSENLCGDMLNINITSPRTFGPYSNYSNADGERATSYDDAALANFTSEKANLAANLCTDIAGTNYFGNNILFICGVLHTAQWIASDLLSSMSLLDDEITGTRIDNMTACMGQLNENISAIKENADSTNGDIAELKEKLDLVIQLLNTPSGRRDSFPVK